MLEEGKRERKRKEDYEKAVNCIKYIDAYAGGFLYTELKVLKRLASESYLDSEEKYNEMLEVAYIEAGKLFSRGDYDAAKEIYNILSFYEYLDSSSLYHICADKKKEESKKKK